MDKRKMDKALDEIRRRIDLMSGDYDSSVIGEVDIDAIIRKVVPQVLSEVESRFEIIGSVMDDIIELLNMETKVKRSFENISMELLSMDRDEEEQVIIMPMFVDEEREDTIQQQNGNLTNKPSEQIYLIPPGDNEFRLIIEPIYDNDNMPTINTPEFSYVYTSGETIMLRYHTLVKSLTNYTDEYDSVFEIETINSSKSSQMQAINYAIELAVKNPGEAGGIMFNNDGVPQVDKKFFSFGIDFGNRSRCIIDKTKWNIIKMSMGAINDGLGFKWANDLDVEEVNDESTNVVIGIRLTLNEFTYVINKDETIGLNSVRKHFRSHLGVGKNILMPSLYGNKYVFKEVRASSNKILPAAVFNNSYVIPYQIKEDGTVANFKKQMIVQATSITSELHAIDFANGVIRAIMLDDINMQIEEKRSIAINDDITKTLATMANALLNLHQTTPQIRETDFGKVFKSFDMVQPDVVYIADDQVLYKEGAQMFDTLNLVLTGKTGIIEPRSRKDTKKMFVYDGWRVTIDVGEQQEVVIKTNGEATIAFYTYSKKINMFHYVERLEWRKQTVHDNIDGIIIKLEKTLWTGSSIAIDEAVFTYSVDGKIQKDVTAIIKEAAISETGVGTIVLLLPISKRDSKVIGFDYIYENLDTDCGMLPCYPLYSFDQDDMPDHFEVILPPERFNVGQPPFEQMIFEPGTLSRVIRGKKISQKPYYATDLVFERKFRSISGYPSKIREGSTVEDLIYDAEVLGEREIKFISVNLIVKYLGVDMQPITILTNINNVIQSIAMELLAANQEQILAEMGDVRNQVTALSKQASTSFLQKVSGVVIGIANILPWTKAVTILIIISAGINLLIAIESEDWSRVLVIVVEAAVGAGLVGYKYKDVITTEMVAFVDKLRAFYYDIAQPTKTLSEKMKKVARKFQAGLRPKISDPFNIKPKVEKQYTRDFEEVRNDNYISVVKSKMNMVDYTNENIAGGSGISNNIYQTLKSKDLLGSYSSIVVGQSYGNVVDMDIVPGIKIKAGVGQGLLGSTQRTMKLAGLPLPINENTTIGSKALFYYEQPITADGKILTDIKVPLFMPIDSDIKTLENEAIYYFKAAYGDCYNVDKMMKFVDSKPWLKNNPHDGEYHPIYDSGWKNILNSVEKREMNKVGEQTSGLHIPPSAVGALLECYSDRLITGDDKFDLILNNTSHVASAIYDVMTKGVTKATTDRAAIFASTYMQTFDRKFNDAMKGHAQNDEMTSSDIYNMMRRFFAVNEAPRVRVDKETFELGTSLARKQYLEKNEIRMSKQSKRTMFKVENQLEHNKQMRKNKKLIGFTMS